MKALISTLEFRINRMIFSNNFGVFASFKTRGIFHFRVPQHVLCFRIELLHKFHLDIVKMEETIT